ncbi:MAG TPA: hypothetical protein VGX03_38010 [Candidatus Binatia bacterium]|jgi:hypothetical protein|nr:hypothetical protein [Candidatus Binatia bacterium]
MMSSIKDWRTGHAKIDTLLVRALHLREALFAESDAEYGKIFASLGEDPPFLDDEVTDINAPLPERPDVRLLPPRERLVLAFAFLHWYQTLPEAVIGSFADWLTRLAWNGGEDLEFLLQKTKGQPGVLGMIHHILTEVAQQREAWVSEEDEGAAERLSNLDETYASCIHGDELWAAVAALLESMPDIGIEQVEGHVENPTQKKPTAH